MPRVFLGNFDFEHELAAGPKWQPGGTLRRINAELTCAWLAEAAPEDAICCPALPDEEFLRHCAEWLGWRPRFEQEVGVQHRGWELIPWGWSQQAVTWGAQRRLTCTPPPLEIVREVNDRLFSHAMESEWDMGLPGSTVIRSIDELRRQIGNGHHSHWVVKARFGMSGRERLLGRGSELPESSLNWLQSRLTRDGAAIFEPWVKKIAEAGLQWDIPQTGPPRFLGMTPLLSDAQGGYRGNRLVVVPTQVAAEWEPAVETTRRTAERIQQLGYCGPLGIDAMQWQDAEGAIRCRPLQDINARWTMGRLTLGWRRVLGVQECGTWLHSAQGRDMETKLGENLPDGCRAWGTSPRTIAGQRCHHASVLIACIGVERCLEVEKSLLLQSIQTDASS